MACLCACFCICISFLLVFYVPAGFFHPLSLSFVSSHLSFFCPSPWVCSPFKGALKGSTLNIFCVKNRRRTNLSREWGSQILCLGCRGMCGCNIIVLQSSACLYVRYWCQDNLRTGGIFDCPCCLELFTPTLLFKYNSSQIGHTPGLFSICAQNPFTGCLQVSAAALCRLSVSCFIFLFASLPHGEWVFSFSYVLWLFPFLTFHFPVKITFHLLVKLWKPSVYLQFAALSFLCESDRQTLTWWRLTMCSTMWWHRNKLFWC